MEPPINITSMNSPPLTTIHLHQEPVSSYSDLKLIQKPIPCAPDSETLKDCPGHLLALPLRRPNTNPKRPETIVDMVNILAMNPSAQALFDLEIAETQHYKQQQQQQQHNNNTDHPHTPPPPTPTTIPAVYNYETSDLMKQALKSVRSGCCHKPGPAGHAVQPGCLSFYKHNGMTFAVGPGKWLLMNFKAKWTSKNVCLRDEPTIQVGSVLIVQVPMGHAGRVVYHNEPVLLAVGTHVFNGTAKDVGTLSLNNQEAYWNHSNKYHAVRVGQGQLAKVWVEWTHPVTRVKSMQPRFLHAGEHLMDSHSFQFDELVQDDAPYIAHGSLHKVAVDKGRVAKVWEQGSPKLLGEGVHVLYASNFKYCGTEELAHLQCLVHGTITILRVPNGKIAVCWSDMEPVFIMAPGLHERDSPDFKFVEMRDSSEPVIQLGSKKMIMVHTGQVAVTHDQGKLQILTHGHHVLESSNHVFQRFLSTQQTSVRLKTHSSLQEVRKAPKKGGILKSVVFPNDLESCSFEESKRREKEASPSTDSLNDAAEEEEPPAQQNEEDLELVVSETKDLVRVGMRADVLYSIVDAAKLIEKADPDKLEDMIRDTSVSTLTNIIRSTALYEIAKWTHVQGGDDPPRIKFLDPLSPGDDAPTTKSGTGFFEQLQEKFMTQLKSNFLEEYGVRLAEIQITSFKIMDEALADQIAKHALTTAQLENKVAQLEAKSKLFTAEEHTASEVKRIAAVADREAQKYRAEAKNERDIESAKAKAEMLKITELAKAEAESEAMLLRAKAEAEAMRIRTLAEAERAELLSRTSLGRQLALMDRYAEMVIQSHKHMKAINVDPSSHMHSPFGALSPAIVSADLRTLEKMAPTRSSGSGRSPSSTSTALTTCLSSNTEKERGRRPSSSSGSERRSRSATRRNESSESGGRRRSGLRRSRSTSSVK